MSGPKYGQATLTAAKRAEILAALAKRLAEEAERNKIVELNRKIKLTSKVMKKIQKEFNSDIFLAIYTHCKEIIPEDPLTKRLGNIRQNALNISVNSSECNTVKECEERVSELNAKLYQLQACKDQMFAILPVIKELCNETNIDNKEKIFLSKTFEEFKAVGEELESSDLFRSFCQLTMEIGGREAEVEALKELIKNKMLDTPYKKKQIELHLEALKMEQMQLQKDDKLIDEIKGMQKILGLTESIPKDSDTRRELHAQLKKRMESELVEDYVNLSMEEVMTECGYNVLRSDIVNSGQHRVRKEYFDYSEDSTLQVATSNAGAVMFEVQSRKKTSDINLDDKHSVALDMEGFCPDYQKIKEKLATKGVIICNEKLFPPDKKYVRSASVDLPPSTKKKNRRANFLKQGGYLYADDRM